MQNELKRSQVIDGLTLTGSAQSLNLHLSQLFESVSRAGKYLKTLETIPLSESLCVNMSPGFRACKMGLVLVLECIQIEFQGFFLFSFNVYGESWKCSVL